MAEGYFTDDSMLRRVVSERVMVLAGGRTLLMQAAHPVAWAGFFAHTGALDAARAERELGWRATTGVADGLRLTLDSL